MGLLWWLWVLAFTGSVIKTAAQTTQTLTWTSPAKGEALVWGRAYPLMATASRTFATGQRFSLICAGRSAVLLGKTTF